MSYLLCTKAYHF